MEEVGGVEALAGWANLAVMAWATVISAFVTVYHVRKAQRALLEEQREMMRVCERMVESREQTLHLVRVVQVEHELTRLKLDCAQEQAAELARRAGVTATDIHRAKEEVESWLIERTPDASGTLQ